MQKVLEVKDLTKKFKNGRGVKNISFEVYKGDIFGFLGANGAGKTTVMKLITGLMKKDNGLVRVFGYDLDENFEKVIKKVGCVIETANSYEYMSAYANLELISRYYKDVDAGRIYEVLKLVDLYKYKADKVKNFSLGMKQRLGLAAAVLANPELVILDEPTNGLDASGMVDIRNTIINLSMEKGITFFISSHLIHEIELMCNRICIINDGEIISEGSVQALLKDNCGSLEDYFINEVRQERRLAANE